MYSVRRVGLSATAWTVARPGSSVHGILQKESWSGSPCPLPRDLPDPGIERLHNQADSSPLGHLGRPERNARRQNGIAFCFHPREPCLSNTPVTYAAPRRVLKKYQAYGVINWISQRVVLGWEKGW